MQINPGPRASTFCIWISKHRADNVTLNLQRNLQKELNTQYPSSTNPNQQLQELWLYLAVHPQEMIHKVRL